jgi:hypothetical protein
MYVFPLSASFEEKERQPASASTRRTIGGDELWQPVGVGGVGAMLFYGRMIFDGRFKIRYPPCDDQRQGRQGSTLVPVGNDSFPALNTNA